MGICNKCGAQVADGVKFCTSCGNPIAVAQPQAAQQPPQAPPQQQYHQTPPAGNATQGAQQQYQQRAYTPPPAHQYNNPPHYAQPYQQPVYTEEPISTGSYVLMFLLLMIPVVNLICIIVWACGGSSKKNKVNLSRAMLIWMLIGAVIGGIVALAGGMLLSGVGGLEGLQDTLTNGLLDNLN